MKKAAAILSTAVIWLFSFAASGESFVTYAKIKTDTALFNGSGEVICTLPATYFAVIDGEIQRGKYPVSYLDLSGYVNSADLEICDFEPVTKFAALTATPDNDGMAVNLRSVPSTSVGEVLTAVPNGASLTLYGGTTGSELFAGAGNEWKYVRYDSPSGKIYGYVYAPQLNCDAVKPNVIEAVPRPSQNVTETKGGINLTKPAAIAVAAAMCVPAGIIMLVLFYRPESKRTPRHSSK